MNYKEQLKELSKVEKREGYLVKYVPGEDKDGVLTEHAKKELLSMGQGSEEGNNEIDIVKMRDSMGWPAVDISENKLTIKNKIIEGSINVRIYKQEKVKSKAPALVFIHGGGFFGGSIDNVENICRAYADKSGYTIFSVDYKLAPENPYPTGLLDCYRTVKWIHDNAEILNIDDSKIFISGDSAGGNLSLTTSILDIMLGTKYIKKIVSFYPVTIAGTKGEGPYWDFSKLGANEESIGLVSQYINGFASSNNLVDTWYAGKVDMKNHLISPMLADEKILESLPPTLLIVGEFDPLRLQGEDFVKRVREAKGNITYLRYNGEIHAFMDKIGDYPQAEDGILEAVKFLED